MPLIAKIGDVIPGEGSCQQLNPSFIVRTTIRMPLIGEIGDVILGEMRVEWSLGDFFSLSKNVGDFYQSPDFSFAGTQWYMRLYPNGQTKNSSSGWVSFFLWQKDSGQSKVVYFTLGIKGSYGLIEKVPKEIEREFSVSNGLGYGFLRTWTRSYLRQKKSILLPNKELTVTCDLRSDARSTIDGEKKLLKSLRDVLESGEDSDVVIKVQGKEFAAHKVILRSRSPVFRSMFHHDMLEKQSDVVTIEECDSETFQDFLAHIYSGSCEQISNKNVLSLFATADKYDIGELKGACTDFMLKNFSITCFCDVIALAVKYNEKKLIESGTEFFCSNSLDIVKTIEWQTFIKENMTVGNELIIKTLSK